MDSQPQLDGYLLEVVDNEWRQEELPFDYISVASENLPDPEADNGDPHLTLNEQEQRWTDLGFSTLAPELSINDQINITLNA